MAIAEGTIQLRRGTAAYFTGNNPTLSAGEPGWESDTNKLKIGDGTTAWTSLNYWYEANITGIDGGTEPTYTAGFSAGAYGTVELWLKADEGVTSGAYGNITEWQDFSGNNRHLSAGAAAMFSLYITDDQKNGLPGAVALNTVWTTYMSGAITASQPATIFLVGRSYLRATEALFFDGKHADGDAGRWIIGSEFNGVGKMGLWAGSVDTNLALAYTTDTFAIWCGIINGASSSLREYTGTPATGNAGAYDLENLQLGAGYTGGGAGIEGQINELLIYSGVMSEPNIAIVLGYLNSKWDIY